MVSSCPSPELLAIDSHRPLLVQVWGACQCFRKTAHFTGRAGQLCNRFGAVRSCEGYEVSHPSLASWGAASSHADSVMLVGRAFQGVGSGIILSLVEIVQADLIPLSQRYVLLI